MTRIYSYVLRIDDGAAPNPFWGFCTLTICKPAIRRKAQIGDWIIGTGSKNSKLSDGKLHDFSNRIVYAMKVSDIKLLCEYDSLCTNSLHDKIPIWKTQDWRRRVGDCIYDYSKGILPIMRKGVHNEDDKRRDLSGVNSLISDCFYYFGSKAQLLPPELRVLIKKSQGHKKIENFELIRLFEKWINLFEKNKMYADPQMRWFFDRQVSDEELSKCAKRRLADDKIETEETID